MPTPRVGRNPFISAKPLREYMLRKDIGRGQGGMRNRLAHRTTTKGKIRFHTADNICSEIGAPMSMVYGAEYWQADISEQSIEGTTDDI